MAFKPRLRYGFLIMAASVAALVVAGVCHWREGLPVAPETFDGQRAYADLAYQVNLGPRLPGSEAHAQTVAWIGESLESAGWQTTIQEATMMGHLVRNVVARRGKEGAPLVILGAHYDSRLVADKDPDITRRSDPVVGANDGASGVAVLLEIARVLPRDLNIQVWLVFFDAEDNGGVPGWDWILGSTAFVQQLTLRPEAAVILDMIGDADLDLYFERNSDGMLRSQIWEQAAALGYDAYFHPSPKYAILDDHSPFLAQGIPAVDLIDFDYPYHHTTADTLDKVSAESLKVVGDTVLTWLLHFEP